MADQVIKLSDLYNRVSFLSRKDTSGGWLDANRFNSILNAVEIQFIEAGFRIFEQTQDVIDHLRPFVVYNPFVLTDGNGKVLFPDDYAHRLSIEGLWINNPAKCSQREIEIERNKCPYLRINEIASVLGDAIAKPSLEERIFYHTIRNNKIEIFPPAVYYIGLNYLRYPKYGKLVWTITDAGGQDLVTINETDTINLEWEMITFNDFVIAICQSLGVEIKDPFLMQYANSSELLRYLFVNQPPQ